MKRSTAADAVVRVLFGLALPLLTVTSSLSAVTVDTSSSASATGQASLSWQHTVGSGADRMLLVGLSYDTNPPGMPTVTYAGNPLSITSSLSTQGGAHVQIWELVAPPVGTAAVVVTLSTTEDFAGGAVSFFGVDQTTPYLTWSANDGSGSPVSTNVATALGEMVVHVVTVDRGPTLTVGPGNTEQWNLGPAAITGGGSTAPGNGGTVTMSWTFSGNDKWVWNRVLLRPTGAGTFEVNSTGDAIDIAHGDGACDTGDTNAVGATECTLRAAIEETNASTVPNKINFDIPTLDPGYNATGNGEYTIRPGSALPDVTEQLLIDGTTQPGFSGTPIIELDGTNAGLGVHGLNLTHTDCTVRGLVINRFDDAGLRMGNARSTLEGSYIGLDVTGTLPRGNGGNGVSISLVGGCTVGGTAPGAGNVISANGGNGVSLGSGSTATIQGNIIGLDAGGSVDLGNGDSGIRLWGRDSLVGGTLEAARNIVSGNGYSGIFVEGDDNVIQGNYLGTDITGTVGKGNTGHGILVPDTTDRLRIGGTEAGARNVISGNTGDGIQNIGYDALIENNHIGVDVNGDPLGNGMYGIRILRVTGGTIGGIAEGTANIIAHNGWDGIQVGGDGVDDHHFLGNRIFANQQVGIDLGTDDVTENDLNDADAGPNDLLNFPEITSATASGGTVSVSFDLDVPVGNYRVEFFRNPSGNDPSGNGEGELFASAVDITHTGSGVESFAHGFPGTTGNGLTATATECTDPSCTAFGSTSEFSDASSVVAGTPGVWVVNSGGDSIDISHGDGSCFTGGTNSASAPECTLRAAIEEANAMIGADEIRFEIPDGDSGYQNLGPGLSYWRIQPASALPPLSDAATTIDGGTQTTYAIGQGFAVNGNGPEIEIRGTGAGAVDGLLLVSAGNTVRDLVINGFGQAGMAGVKISGSSATDNTVSGCYLGTNAAGTVAVENNRGVSVLNGAQSNTIGGANPGDGNLLSGNNVGAYIAGAGTDLNQIAGNLVGTTASGTAGLPNSIGMTIEAGAQSNTIGGTTENERNVVSGNATVGIMLRDAGTSFNSFVGNYIGPDVTGTAALGNTTGIAFNAASSNTVGGATAGHRNVISGNSHGVSISSSASSNLVQGNYIGTDPGGTVNLGNTNFGITISSPAISNVIGGTGNGEGNLIAFNGKDGVWLLGADADSNRISGNSIFSNVELGIDLDPDGVGTGNGANEDKSPPTMDTIMPSGGNFVVTASTDLGDVVEFFRANNGGAPVVGADPSGSGEGFLFLGSCEDDGACSGPHVVAAADGDGSAGTVQVTILSSGLINGDFVTATATDVAGNTSEFAVNVQAAGAAPEISGTVFEDLAGDGLADGSIGDANNPAVQNVDVHLYRDEDEDSNPEASDTFVTTVQTDVAGAYSFTGLAAGRYFVVVDSKSVSPASAFTSGSTQADVWAEQTYGPAGRFCANGSGGTVIATPAGPCYAGRLGGASDDLTTWYSGAEHLATIPFTGGSTTGVDFGFSFNVVVNTRGGDATDDDAGSNRTVQGSLRQFIQNANAITGPNAMRLVPAEPTNADDGGGNSWWRITASDPAVVSPEAFLVITDASTTVDGTAYSLSDGVTVRDTNFALVGTPGPVGVGPDGTAGSGDEAAISSIAGPELEIVDGLADPAQLDRGLDLNANGSTIRAVAIHGFGASTGADIVGGGDTGDPVFDGVVVEDCVIGTTATGAVPGSHLSLRGLRFNGWDNGTIRRSHVSHATGQGATLYRAIHGWLVADSYLLSNGQDGLYLVDDVSVTFRRILVQGNTGHGITVIDPPSTLTVEDSTFRSNDSGGNLGDNSNSTVTRSLFETNGNRGLFFHGSSNLVTGNVIRNNTSDGVFISINSSGNTVSSNQITGNGQHGIYAFSGTSGTISGNQIQGSASAGVYLGGSGYLVASNTVTGNAGSGVVVRNSSSGNEISQNTFGGNGGISIDLSTDTSTTGDGISTNSAAPPDCGTEAAGNLGLDTPVIGTADWLPAGTTVSGLACAGATIEVYRAVADADASDELLGVRYGEGVEYLGSTTADAVTGAFSVSGLAGLLIGDDVSALATSAGGNTSEFAASVTVEGGRSISGTVYHDVNANGVLDIGELGIGSAWVKLLDGGGAVIQVVAADPDGGSYTLTHVTDGDYTVIVDDNNLIADSTPTAPVNWLFQNPAAGSLAVTVAGADIVDQNFGLIFDFDLSADCSCGYEDGLFTQQTITIDGDMADWAPIFTDGDNNACDATDDTDLDHPVQSTGRNLLRTAVTHDASYFSMWTQRVGSSNNVQNFIYYADTSNDGILQAGEPVIVAKWQGNTGTVTLERYSYDDLGSGGDPLLDSNGFADGYSMPGDLTLVKTLTMPDGAGQGSTTGSTAGIQMEWTVSWAEIGVAPGAAIAWHIGSTNANPGSAGLGAQIDDNLGGCGGQCTGSNQFAGVVVTPISGGTGQTVYSSYGFTNTGNGDDLFDLAWTSSGDFAPVSVTFYEDLGTVGEFDLGVDVLLTDTDGDTDPDTGVMGSGASFDLLIAIELPGPGTVGSATVTTTATSNFVPGCGGTVVPVSGSVDDPVQIVPKIVKRAFESDGTPISNGTTVPQGAAVKFLIYVDNPGAELTDVSVQDVLDAAFLYQENSIKVDNTLQSSVVCPGGLCDEAAIFASVNGQAASTDDVDGDAVSYTGASTTIDAGNQNQSNAQLDIAADSVWALLFTVQMQ